MPTPRIRMCCCTKSTPCLWELRQGAVAGLMAQRWPCGAGRERSKQGSKQPPTPRVLQQKHVYVYVPVYAYVWQSLGSATGSLHVLSGVAPALLGGEGGG